MAADDEEEPDDDEEVDDVVDDVDEVLEVMLALWRCLFLFADCSAITAALLMVVEVGVMVADSSLLLWWCCCCLLRSRRMVLIVPVLPTIICVRCFFVCCFLVDLSAFIYKLQGCSKAPIICVYIYN